MRRHSLVAPLLLIAIGALLLARNVYPELRVADYLAQYWPFVLIAWGGLRLIEILYWSVTDKPLPSRGVSGGEWLVVFLVCIVGAGFHTARNMTDNWQFRMPWGNVDFFGEHFEYPLNAEHAASKTPRIVIEDFRGDLRINGSEMDSVKIIGRKSIGAFEKRLADRAAAASNLEISGDPNDLTIRLKDDFRGPARVSTTLDISVPKGARIEARRRDGDFRVAGTDGSVDVKGRGGDIDLDGIGGPVTIEGNFSGSLHAHNISKTLRFKGRRTEFQVEKIAGDLRVDSGDFVASNVMGPMSISSRSDDVKVSGFTNALTVNVERGDLDLEPLSLPLSSIQVRSRSGDIRLALPSEAQFTLNASTDSGDISNTFGGGLKMESSGPHQTLRGSVGSGAPISIETRRGDVSIRKGGAVELSGPLQKIEQ